MPVIDTRGRLFGAINLIDFAALVCVALLLPLVYGAYMLFRTPPSRIVAAVPNSLPYVKTTEQHIQITGRYLRPFLRARLGDNQAKSFTLLSPEAAEIRFADIPPGLYDIVLLDESQEVARLPKALTIEPPPLQLLGSFSGDTVLSPGLTFAGPGSPQLLTIDASSASRRRATVRIICLLSPSNECLLGTTPVRAGADLTLAMTAGSTAVFHVDELRVDASWQDVVVRLMGLSASLDNIRVGDVDTRIEPSAPVDSPIAHVMAGARVLSLGERLKGQGTYAITAVRPQPGTDVSGYGVLSATMPVDAESADLLVPVDAHGLYRGVAVQPGNLISFDGAAYRLQGVIVSVPK
jgi:hypothetical protein